MYCYHFDGVGNTVAITDSSETVVNSYDYSPFGIIISENETFPQPFKFVGKLGVMAESNGFYYMRARYYDPVIGRFISEDPLGFDGGDVNLYVYGGNNPLLVVDPSGLFDLFLVFEGDLVGIIGAEGGFGLVLDLDNLGESGIFRTRGAAGGANAGISVGVGFALRELEGESLNYDINAKVVSPTINFDSQGFNGLSGGIGPGVGASTSYTNTSTYSINNLIRDTRRLFGHGK